ncbi:MAG: FAD-binding oxidoreductase [Thermomicrobiales bacterium]
MMRVIVVGAGVVGSGLAWRLASQGQDVVLVERGQPATGTTGSSFSWYNANSKRPEDYFRLNLAGMEAHLELREQLGEAPWYHEGGNIVWSSGEAWKDSGEIEENLEVRVAELQRWDYPAEWIAVSEAEKLEPLVHFGDGVEQVAYFQSEGWVDGPLFAGSMARLAAEAGAEVRYGSEVVAVEMRDGRVSGVRLANDDVLNADLIMNCAGPWADKLAKMAGRELPLAPTVGFITRISGVPEDIIHRVMHAPRVHMRPDGGGLIALHHGDADAGITSGDKPWEWAEELVSRFKTYVPEASDARVSRWTVAHRPIPVDGRTSAGLLSSIPGYGEIVTHSAITMGALLPKIVAHEITTGEQDPLLANFRPDRFGG